jgi:hypothetical protein
MTFPSLQQYQLAVQHPRIAFTDPVLASGLAKSTTYGPSVMSGAFALTYRITSGTPPKAYAVRCFHSGATDARSRYEALSSYIGSLKSEYFVDFRYIAEGILVEGVKYPIVRMEWANGVTLGEFLEANYHDARKLHNLATSLRKLARFLEERSIAHGDIQPGNLMVAGDGSRIQLIDYDGMFIPAVGALGSSEQGHRNFQHPSRSTQFEPTLDRFAFILLDVALRALQIDAGLWDTLKCDPDLLLLGSNDFRAPTSSPGFLRLAKTPGMVADVDRLAAICEAPFEQVPSLSQFLAGKPVEGRAVRFGARPSAGRAPYASRHKVLDAENFAAFDAHNGRMGELIGCIVQVAPQTTGGKSYCFINFSDWKKKPCVRLIIWSDVLPKMRKQPSANWVGQWVSVKGVVRAKYTNKPKDGRPAGHPSISVFIELPNQVVFIDEEEAQYRLGRLSSQPSIPRMGNQEILRSLPPQRAPRTENTSAPRPVPVQLKSPSTATTNKDVLAKIQQLKAVKSAAQASPPPKVGTANPSFGGTSKQANGNRGPANQPSPRFCQRHFRTDTAWCGIGN